MNSWLLMMTLCFGSADCQREPIDAFDSRVECEAAQHRADVRQQTIESADRVTFACQRDGDRRA